MPSKKRFSTDSHNRLLVYLNKKPVALNGSFKVDGTNGLRFLDAGGNSQRFEGRWRLNADHNLEFKIRRSGRSAAAGLLTLGGRIVSTANDELAFEMITHDAHNRTHLYLLKLSGAWLTDRQNRIIFEIKRQASPDILTLTGAWQVNKNQEIEYSFKQKKLKRRLASEHSLVWNGSWKISEAGRLVYYFGVAHRSIFEFRCQLESSRISHNHQALRYRVGIGLRGKKGFSEKEVLLFGVWKISERLGITFEMRRAQGVIDRLEFGADYALTGQDALTVSLVNAQHKPVGIKIFLTRRFKF